MENANAGVGALEPIPADIARGRGTPSEILGTFLLLLDRTGESDRKGAKGDVMT